MTKQKILSISGRKQSGKDSCYQFLRQQLGDGVQQFSFATPLKRMCIDILGCPEDLVYGTDAQKNTPVPHLLWENFPITAFQWPTHKCGPMTVREVLQYWGTEIFRRAYHNVWADACIRAIQKSDCYLAVITDCRFPNEVDVVHRAGGRVIRLTRVVFPNDHHASEFSLDADHYDWSNFDAILDNQHMSLPCQNEALEKILTEWGWITTYSEDDL